MAEAENDINKSIGLDPYNGWAYRNKGLFYLLNKDFINSERLLKQAVEMDSFIDKIYFYLGTAYLKNGKQKLACESFSESEKLGDKMVTAELIKQCK
jgi:tetratricopeptide (TPR) repeat protein